MLKAFACEVVECPWALILQPVGHMPEAGREVGATMMDLVALQRTGERVGCTSL